MLTCRGCGRQLPKAIYNVCAICKVKELELERACPADHLKWPNDRLSIGIYFTDDKAVCVIRRPNEEPTTVTVPNDSVDTIMGPLHQILLKYAPYQPLITAMAKGAHQARDSMTDGETAMTAFLFFAASYGPISIFSKDISNALNIARPGNLLNRKGCNWPKNYPLDEESPSAKLAAWAIIQTRDVLEENNG